MYQIAMWIGMLFMLIFALLSVVFFVHDHVGKLIGDVTGWNAKCAMNEMKRKRMERQQKKVYDKETFEPEQETEMIDLKNGNLTEVIFDLENKNAMKIINNNRQLPANDIIARKEAEWDIE